MSLYCWRGFEGGRPNVLLEDEATGQASFSITELMIDHYDEEKGHAGGTITFSDNAFPQTRGIRSTRWIGLRSEGQGGYSWHIEHDQETAGTYFGGIAGELIFTPQPDLNENLKAIIADSVSYYTGSLKEWDEFKEMVEKGEAKMLPPH